MKVYYEIIVQADIVDEICEYLIEEGCEIEYRYPAQRESIVRSLGVGIAYLSEHSCPFMYYDLVYSCEVDKQETLDNVTDLLPTV